MAFMLVLMKKESRVIGPSDVFMEGTTIARWIVQPEKLYDG